MTASGAGRSTSRRLPAASERAPFRRLLQFLEPARGAFATVVLLIFLESLTLIGQARVLAVIIDAAFLGGQALAALKPLLLIFLGLNLLRAACAWSGDLLAQYVSSAVKSTLRSSLLAQILARGPAWVQQERSGELTTLISEGVEQLDAYFRLYLPQAVQAVLLPISILLMVFPFDRTSGLVLLLTAPLIPLFMVLIGSTASQATAARWQSLQTISAQFLDILSGITTLKLFGRSRTQQQRLRALNDAFHSTTMQVLRITFLSALVLELLSTLSTAVVAVQIGLRLLYARIAFVDAFFILLLTPDFFLPLRMLGLRFHAGMAGTAAAANIFRVLELKARSPEPIGTETVVAGHHDIHFNNVSYTYSTRNFPAIASITCTLPAGRTSVLVGPSGAGKSTLTYLLLGFLQPHTGAIRVGPYDLSRLDLAKWRSQIAWVPQQPTLLHDTVFENIRFSVPGATRASVERAASAAHADAFIRALPEGYDTLIGERGARLSGGQGQRLALARAFLKDAPLLILDEPAAQLDLETEKQLLDSIHALTRNRTVLLVAHRLQTIQRAENVLFLNEDGGIRQMDGGQYLRLISGEEQLA